MDSVEWREMNAVLKSYFILRQVCKRYFHNTNNDHNSKPDYMEGYNISANSYNLVATR